MTISPRTSNKIVNFVFDEIQKQSLKQIGVCKKAGIHRSSMSRWKTKSQPKLHDLEAVLETLGFRLEVVENDPSL